MLTFRLLCALGLVLIVGVPAGCGGHDAGSSAAPGSPENPLVGHPIAEDEPETGPRDILNPCDLLVLPASSQVTDLPFSLQEAPQGPTCLIRPKSGDGQGMLTLAVQSVDFAKLRSQLRQPRSVTVSGRTAYCGQYGQTMLYLPLGRHKVLSIAGPCPMAQEIAVRAVEHLES
jgi:hypothetical protein